jgi:ABC-type lipoprotein export system ATPase subunit
MTDPLVALRDVFCVHRTDQGDAAALQGATCRIAAGEIVCVLGPSGAGKSTMLRVIAGLQTPAAGVVSVFGLDIGRLRGSVRARLRHERIGFLGQDADATLPPDLPIAEAVAMPLYLRGAGREARRTRVAELLGAAGIADRARAFPSELSGGERQRVAVCCALAHHPSLLLADEPTGELDDASAARVRELIAGLAGADGATVIVVSHDPATAAIADRSLSIRDGRIVEERRDGEDGFVVGRGGWLQLPPALLARVGIGERARAEIVDGALIVRPAAGAPAEPDDVPPDGPRWFGRGPWSPARVEVHGLVANRGDGAARRAVLDGFTRSFGAGRMTAVTGRSGVGKTTLLRLLAGLDRADAGELLIDDLRVSEYGAEELAALRRERIGYLPQEPTPVPFLSAEENVALALQLRAWAPGDADARAAIVLASVGLADRARQRISRLSAGEAQRVALARALASARGLLIVDEPSSRLDRAGAAAIAELLAAAAAQDGQTVICATHDPELIARADEVLAL